MGTSELLFISNILDHGMQRWEQFKAQQVREEQARNQQLMGARHLRQVQDSEYQRLVQEQTEKQILQNIMPSNDEIMQSESLNEATAAESKEEDDQKIEKRINDANEKLKKISSLIENAPKNELIKVALRLPNGKRVEYTFWNQNTIESIFDFANTFKLKIEDTYIEELELVCSYPKRVFTTNDFDKTLKDLGIQHSML